MRFYIFLNGLTIIAMGLASMYLLDRSESLGFLQGALTLGGGIVICGIFSIKMQWHGIIGAGVLGLLGAGRGLGNTVGLAKFLSGDQSRGPAPVLEFGVTMVCALLVIKIIRVLSQERTRRMLEAEE